MNTREREKEREREEGEKKYKHIQTIGAIGTHTRIESSMEGSSSLSGI